MELAREDARTAGAVEDPKAVTHTPGPWVVHERLSGSENHRGFDIWSDPKRFRVAGEVYPIDADGSEGRANAHLIAAAPDLLAALQAGKAANAALDGGADFNEWVDLDENFRVLLSAAIAKAEGR